LSVLYLFSGAREEISTWSGGYCYGVVARLLASLVVNLPLTYLDFVKSQECVCVCVPKMFSPLRVHLSAWRRRRRFSLHAHEPPRLVSNNFFLLSLILSISPRVVCSGNNHAFVTRSTKIQCSNRATCFCVLNDARADTNLLCNSRARRLEIAGRWNFNKQSGGNPRESERYVRARQQAAHDSVCISN
jgi:hypothetical protein